MIRSSLKRGLKKVLGLEEEAARSAPPVPAARTSEPAAPAARVPDSVSPPNVSPAPEPVQVAEARAEAIVEAVGQTIQDSDDTAGAPLSLEAVQEILDEMVRPALQGDGGDITLLKVEENNIYVKLVGSCSTCPSSIMTMKMGVEALLREEFPSMNELIQVD